MLKVDLRRLRRALPKGAIIEISMMKFRHDFLLSLKCSTVNRPLRDDEDKRLVYGWQKQILGEAFHSFYTVRNRRLWFTLLQPSDYEFFHMTKSNKLELNQLVEKIQNA